jgi:type II secretory pathway pseudopilin PulG
MKKAFTIVEVSILFVIFLIVAFLVAPLSLDDTLQAKNAARWRNVQSDFGNIIYSVNTQKENEDFAFNKVFNETMKKEIKSNAEPYKITYMNGTFPGSAYRFPDFALTYSNATVAYKLYDAPQDGVLGVLMYDVNGQVGPNVWGKDVFGLNIYTDKFEPFCKNDSVATQKQDCSKSGTGLCCSNYYLIGGSFN